MTDIIESMRGLRNLSIRFEATMSDLTMAIGNVERLTDLQPDQLERLWKATARLGNAVAVKSDD
jgi:hypothetical protein